MKRWHLFEVMDQPWCPDVVRRLTTDFMGTFLPRLRVHAPALPALIRGLRATQATQLVDLCSGAGGPLLAYHRELEQGVGHPLTVVLTDRFPDLRAADRLDAGHDSSVRYRRESIDALHTPADLPGFRTLFESFHHFRPEEARRILQDAVDRNTGIAIIEITERAPATILFLMLVSPLSVYVMTPFVKPLAWWRFALTYALPVTPALSIWETLVSCLRTYTDEELKTMTSSLHGTPYHWEFGRDFTKGPVRWLVGYPAAAPPVSSPTA